MSIIFRLAGSPEYNRVNSRSPYAGRVERQFGKFRDHKVVRMARELRRTRGVSYDAVMSLAVHLRDAQTLAERIPFDQPPARLDTRWRADEARQFLVAARAFAKQSEFAGFMEREREFHTAAAARLQEKIDERDYIEWLDRYFGCKGEAQTRVLVGLLNGGGNYGVGVRYADGREEITPVLGVYQFDEKGLPVPGNDFVGLLAHEISHSYVNAIANGRYFGGGMQIARDAEIDDGQLDVVRWIAQQIIGFDHLGLTRRTGFNFDRAVFESPLSDDNS